MPGAAPGAAVALSAQIDPVDAAQGVPPDTALFNSIRLDLTRDWLPFGETPHTRHVRGSNMTMIGVVADRIEGRAIIVSALDNLVKGASGQAIQNMNLIMGYPEPMGIDQVALFP